MLTHLLKYCMCANNACFKNYSYVSMIYNNQILISMILYVTYNVFVILNLYDKRRVTEDTARKR